MLLFIIIFFAMLIVVGVTMIVGFSVFLKRRNKSLATNEQKQFTEIPPYRSLFEPDVAETQFLERERQAQQIEAERQASAQQILLERARRVEEFQKVWRENPNVKNTAELFLLAAESESAKIFSETVESVIQVWRENRLANLSGADLADLLDSHFRLLPQQERTSGALFWLKREIKNLRNESE